MDRKGEIAFAANGASALPPTKRTKVIGEPADNQARVTADTSSSACCLDLNVETQALLTVEAGKSLQIHGLLALKRGLVVIGGVAFLSKDWERSLVFHNFVVPFSDVHDKIENRSGTS